MCLSRTNRMRHRVVSRATSTSAQFLSRGPRNPQHQALLNLIRTLLRAVQTSEPDAELSRPNSSLLTHQEPPKPYYISDRTSGGSSGAGLRSSSSERAAALVHAAAIVLRRGRGGRWCRAGGGATAHRTENQQRDRACNRQPDPRAQTRQPCCRRGRAFGRPHAAP